MRLEDYLDGMRGDPGLPLGVRGFGTTPVIGPIGPISPVPTPALPSGVRLTPAAIAQVQSVVAAQVLPILAQDALAQRVLDAQMWTLDQRWASAAVWGDMRACIRKVNAAEDASSWAASPWPSDGNCQNLFGNDVPSACNWGFWRLQNCDIPTATTYAFQFPRFLWAQSRMQLLLLSAPVPGVTTPQAAADWCWLAAQLISVLQWSTNVRGDWYAGAVPAAGDPNAVMLTVAQNLRPSGSYTQLAPLGRAGGFTGGENARVPMQGYGNALRTTITGGAVVPSADMPAYDDPFPLQSDVATVWTWWTLNVRSWNIVGESQVLPFNQNDFSPGFLWKWSLQSNLVDGWGRPFDLPFAATESAALMAEMNSAPNEINKGRLAFNKFFQNTWGRRWYYSGTAYISTDFAQNGLNAVPHNVVVRGADGIAADLVKLLTFYSQPSYNYVNLLNDAMQVYNVLTPASSTDPAALQFQNAKAQLMTSVVQAAGQAASMPADPSGSGGYATMAIGMLASLLTLIGGAAALVSYILQGLLQGVQFLISLMTTSGENTFCPTFPFIRVISPSSGAACALSLSQIEGAITGIDSSARWPVVVAGQTRTFNVNGRTFTVTFTAADTTAAAVAARINSFAVLVPLAPVATVRNGQVHVEGDGSTLTRATGGTAAALGFPGPLTTSLVQCPDGSYAATAASCPAPPPQQSGSSGVSLAAGAGLLLLLRLLLG